MRIIRLRYEQEVTCPKCYCEFAYGPRDIEDEGTTGRHIVRCPNCTHKLYVNDPVLIEKHDEYIIGLSKIDRHVDF